MYANRWCVMKDMDKKRVQVKSSIIVVLALLAVAGIAIQSAELRKESICKSEYCYEKRVEGSVFCEKHKKEMGKKKIPDGKDYVNHSNSNSHQNADTNVNKNDSTTVNKNDSTNTYTKPSKYNYYDSYDDGYDDVYFDSDYDDNRYNYDSDYATGVDDAIEDAIEDGDDEW